MTHSCSMISTLRFLPLKKSSTIPNLGFRLPDYPGQSRIFLGPAKRDLLFVLGILVFLLILGVLGAKTR